MITVKHNKEGEYVVSMDTLERNRLNRFAMRFAISAKDMLVALINKGMDTVEKQSGETRDLDKDHGDIDEES